MQEWKKGIWDPNIAFYSTKIRNLLTMGSCNAMYSDNTDNSMFTIPTGPDQEPAPHPPQTQPEHLLPYFLEPLQWMQTSLETSATETT